MVVTREFRQTIMARASNDDAYRKAMLTEAINEILQGNIDAGKAMLRDYIHATITFPALSKTLNKSSKSIHRMLGPCGNPRLDSLVGILKVLQERDRIELRAQ